MLDLVRVKRAWFFGLLTAACGWGTWMSVPALAQTAPPPAVSFLAPRGTETGDIDPRDVELADFNGDGHLDLAVITTQGSGQVVNFLLGDGAGSLLLDNTVRTTYYATGLVSADFNGDGILDFAITQDSSKNGVPDPLCGLLPGTLIFLGAGGTAPTFTSSLCLVAADGAYLNDAAAGDFNADGYVDLAVGDHGSRGLRLYRGNGDGTFQPALPATGSAGVSITGPFAAMDVNGNGSLDLLAHIRGGGFATFVGDGTGQLAFRAPAVGSAALVTQSPRAFAVLDANADGYADVAGVTRGSTAAGGAEQLYVFASLGTAGGLTYTFGSEAHPIAGLDTGTVAVADFNKDGHRDLVVLDRSTIGHAYVFLGRGDGTFAAGPTITVGNQPQFVVTGDWNHDNWTDVAIVDRSPGDQSTTWILEQVPGTGDATPPVVSVTAPAAGSSLQGTVVLAAEASDASGVARVEFYADAILVGIDSTAPYAVPWDTTLVANGSHTLLARAYDSLDNRGTSAPVAVTIANPDTTPPTVTLTPPVGLLSGTALVHAEAADANGITRVELWADDALIGSAAGAPYDIGWNTSGVVAGNHQLQARAYDQAGNVGISPAITVVVDQPPTASAGPAQTVEATSAAGASVTLTGTGSDPDPGDTLEYVWMLGGSAVGVTPSIALSLAPGTHAPVLIVTDSFGAVATDTVQIQVVDTTAPTLVTPGDLVREAASGTGASVSFAVTASDLVDGADLPVDCVPASGSTFPLGSTPVTCTAADGSGNTGSATFAVTVVDTTPPALALPPALTVEASGPTGAAVAFSPAPAAVDLVDGPRPVTCVPASGSPFGMGTTTVSCSAADTRGNAAAGTFTVTVQDTTAPTVSLTAPLADSHVTGVIALAATASDNTGVAHVEFFAGAQSLGIDAAAPYAVEWDTAGIAAGSRVTLRAVAIDAFGGVAQASLTVTVDAPANRPPSASAGPDRTVEATSPLGAEVTLAGSGSDPDAGDTLSFEWTLGSTVLGSSPTVTIVLGLGSHALTLTVTDNHGASASSQTTVVVRDTTAPSLTLPPNQTVEATTALGSAVSFSASAFDAVGGSVLVACVPASGALFAVGETLVTCTATDPSGNMADGSFVVTVRDGTPPAVTPPGPVTIAATEVDGARGNVAGSGASAALLAFIVSGSAADAIDPAPARLSPQASIGGVTVEIAVDTLFPVGTTPVTFRFRDGSGNIGTAVSTLTVAPPVGAAVLMAGVPVAALSSTNAAQPVSVVFGQVLQPGLLVADEIPPAAPPAGFTAAGPAFAISTTALVGAPIAVCLQDARYTSSDRIFQIVNGGWIDVTTTASAANVCGATSSLSTFIVASPQNHPPVADAGAAQVVEATSPDGATITVTGTATDPDPGDTLSYAWHDDGGPLGTIPSITLVRPLGTHTLVLTVTDSRGATSRDTTTVTVRDSVPPRLDLPADVAAEATSAAGAPVDFVVSAVDAVDALPVVVCSRASGSMFPLGNTVVSCTAADASGNTAAGSFTVTVRDTTPPSVTLLSPADGSTVTGTVAIVASASDVTGVVRVEFYSGGQWLATAVAPPYTASLDTRAMPPGTVLGLSARAYDGAGLLASDLAQVTVGVPGAERPEILSRPEGELVVGVPFQYQFAAKGAAPLQWTLERGPEGMAIDPITGLLSWTPRPDQLGWHRGRVRVANAGGTDRQTFVLKVVDGQAPAPPGSPVLMQITAKAVALSWAASGDVDVVGYRVYEYVEKSTGTGAWKVVKRTRQPMAVLEGEPGAARTYAVTAVDAAGNESARSTSLQVAWPDEPS